MQKYKKFQQMQIFRYKKWKRESYLGENWKVKSEKYGVCDAYKVKSENWNVKSKVCFARIL